MCFQLYKEGAGELSFGVFIVVLTLGKVPQNTVIIDLLVTCYLYSVPTLPMYILHKHHSLYTYIHTNTYITVHTSLYTLLLSITILIAQVTYELVDDFERFKVQKASDMQKILLNYVTLQIEYHKQCEATWDALIPTLQVMHDSGTVGNPFEDNSARPPTPPAYPPVSKQQVHQRM